MDWVNILRLANAFGCAIALYLLVTAAQAQWRTWNHKTKQHWWALLGWVALGFESIIENMILGTAAGPRVILTSLVVAWTLRALTIRDELRADSVLQRREDHNE